MAHDDAHKKRRRASLTILYVIIAIAAIASFVAYEVDVDASVVGALWQFVRGDRVDYSGLTISLPRHWVAIRTEESVMLIGVVDHNTARVFFRKIPDVARDRWVQNPLRWVEMIQAKYKSEGYESVTPPPRSALGQPAICVDLVSTSKKPPREIYCWIDGGRTLVNYSGTENDLPKFISLLGSLQSSSASKPRSTQ